jgi:hypothetical protein
MDDLSREEPSNSTILYRHTKHEKARLPFLTRKHTTSKSSGEMQEKRKECHKQKEGGSKKSFFLFADDRKKKKEEKKRKDANRAERSEVKRREKEENIRFPFFPPVAKEPAFLFCGFPQKNIIKTQSLDAFNVTKYVLFWSEVIISSLVHSCPPTSCRPLS